LAQADVEALTHGLQAPLLSEDERFFARIVRGQIDGAPSGGRTVRAARRRLLQCFIDADLHRHRLHPVIADGLRARGGECPNCGWLVSGAVEACPACSNELRADDDIIDLAVRRAFDQSANVQVVHDEAADRLASACQGVGGIVRFRQG
jgi:hypothetical protein